MTSSNAQRLGAKDGNGRYLIDRPVHRLWRGIFAQFTYLVSELTARLREPRGELRAATRQPANDHRLRIVRREISRIETVLRERGAG